MHHVNVPSVITPRQGGYVLIGVCLFVSRITHKLIFTKFDGKVTHGPRKKRLDLGDNPNHVTLGLWLWLGEEQESFPLSLLQGLSPPSPWPLTLTTQ